MNPTHSMFGSLRHKDLNPDLCRYKEISIKSDEIHSPTTNLTPSDTHLTLDKARFVQSDVPSWLEMSFYLSN